MKVYYRILGTDWVEIGRFCPQGPYWTKLVRLAQSTAHRSVKVRILGFSLLACKEGPR